MNKIKYFDIHVNDGVNGYSVFIETKYLTDDFIEADVTGQAIDQGILDSDDLRYVDNVTEITGDEYNKAIM